MFPYAFLQSMDFTFTFNAIMLGFIHLSGAFKHVKAGMQVFVLVALVFMTTYNATSMKNWVALGGVIIVQFVATTLKRFVFYSDNFDFRFLLLGVALWGSAFGSMLAAFAFMGLRKNIRYRCVGEDGVDVLSHEATESARLDKPAFTTTNVVLMSEHDVEAAPGTTQTCTST
ncbi:hypothetical protein DYB26_012905 [Aphanomyces astaci]|uniref:Uncharacterized protein n=1 Tax=Aphanomyces astaci TaxID=112090 RepID=A0A397B296_APHAT|nr:hypothetical protein DYB36_001851 [Aphanomyces astaci]RHY78333.1 hypothetical protein DYB38_010851 [Aphanomyces astaci]RHZ04625.1 hypothetical protein DYB26_012905 [Aphanomyces astaci]